MIFNNNDKFILKFCYQKVFNRRDACFCQYCWERDGIHFFVDVILDAIKDYHEYISKS